LKPVETLAYIQRDAGGETVYDKELGIRRRLW